MAPRFPPDADASVVAATPESYGVPAPGHRLPAPTRLGRVRLQVSDLERSLDYYERVLGLRVLGREGGGATLGARGDGAGPLVELRERPGAAPVPRNGRLGLFHFAILLPDRAALGRFLGHLAERGERAGASDHLVSEALYLHDPDGLGIEVYADRPRAEWRRQGRQLQMATDPLDAPGVLAAAGGEPWDGMPAGTTMGHVHLHVGDLDVAAAFYHQALGFDAMVWSYPGALFLAAGGYHHHLGLNTWARGAPSAGEHEARLLEWTVVLPDAGDVDAAAASLGLAGHPPRLDGAGFAVADPWGTVVRVGTGV